MFGAFRVNDRHILDRVAQVFDKKRRRCVGRLRAETVDAIPFGPQTGERRGDRWNAY